MGLNTETSLNMGIEALKTKTWLSSGPKATGAKGQNRRGGVVKRPKLGEAAQKRMANG